MKVGSSRNGERKCKVWRHCYPPPKCNALISTRLATPNWLGFARRYFTLYESGILSYAFGPGEHVRDQISLSQAAISNEPCQYGPLSPADLTQSWILPARKEIHVDSSNATFHIRCLNTPDFEAWMSALRSADHASPTSITLNLPA